MPGLESIYGQLVALDPLPLLAAVVLGGAIGFEREVHGRPAGLRTHILVCLASTFLIYLSRHLPAPQSELGETGRLVLDPTRLAAGIVTGIGFLGAASVIRSGDIVRGITTGACIWCVAGLGVVIGSEAYGLAIASTLLALAALIALNRFEGLIPGIVYRRLIVHGMAPNVSAVADAVIAELGENHVKVQEVGGLLAQDGEPFQLVFHIRCRGALQAPTVLETVAALEGVTTVEWRPMIP